MTAQGYNLATATTNRKATGDSKDKANGNDNDYYGGEGHGATREGEKNEGFLGLLSGLQVEPAPGAQNDSLRLQLRQQRHPTARQQATAKTRANGNDNDNDNDNDHDDGEGHGATRERRKE